LHLACLRIQLLLLLLLLQLWRRAGLLAHWKLRLLLLLALAAWLVSSAAAPLLSVGQTQACALGSMRKHAHALQAVSGCCQSIAKQLPVGAACQVPLLHLLSHHQQQQPQQQHVAADRVPSYPHHLDPNQAPLQALYQHQPLLQHHANQALLQHQRPYQMLPQSPLKACQRQPPAKASYPSPHLPLLLVLLLVLRCLLFVPAHSLHQPQH
jgi:hypothetical protein